MINFRSVLGYVLIIASGLVLYHVIPIALPFSIFAASFVAVPQRRGNSRTTPSLAML
jgi:hypothetical protein